MEKDETIDDLSHEGDGASLVYLSFCGYVLEQFTASHPASDGWMDGFGCGWIDVLGCGWMATWVFSSPILNASRDL